MSTDYWMLEEDLCRCCHSEGTFQNLAGALNFGEEEENMYFNMLRETLDINMSPVAGSLCAATYTICDPCISRLRDATTFKRQVIRCEQKFNDMYERNFIKLAEPDYKVEIKLEDPEGDAQSADVLLEDNDSMDDWFDDKRDDDEETNTKRIAQEAKKKVKKTPQKAKTKAKPKKPPKKCGRPRKVKEVEEIKEEEPPGNNGRTEDSSFKPVTSKLEQLLTQGGTWQDYLSFTVIEDGNTSKYVCRKCHKNFADEKSIRQHIQTPHINLNENKVVNISSEDVENYICKVCSKEYPNRVALRNHVNTFHRLRKCPDCDLKFPLKNLKMHQQEAHGVQPPTCGICGYKNWSQSRIITHQRKVHMNEKNASCKLCGKKFFSQIYLVRHMIAHGTDRKYECSFCHKKYPRLQTLKLHEKIHTKVKDKVCTVCGEGFVQKASLNYHMKKHHPEAV